jgi:hypothetical protein
MNEGLTPEVLRTPAQITGDLLRDRRAVSEGKLMQEDLCQHVFEGAEEMLKGGHETEAFALMTTGLQMETAIMGKSNAEMNMSVGESMHKTSMDMADAAGNFRASVTRLDESAITISKASSDMADPIASFRSGVRDFGGVAEKISEASRRMTSR